MSNEGPPEVRHAPRQFGEVTLRRTMPADLQMIFEQQCDPESNALAGTKPRTRDVFFSTWERNFSDPHINPRVIQLDGEIVGSIACFQAESRNCVGYWIARQHWGKRIASRALTLFLAEEHRRPLFATACRMNTASHRVLLKSGFRCTGYHFGEETDRYIAREVAEFELA